VGRFIQPKCIFRRDAFFSFLMILITKNRYMTLCFKHIWKSLAEDIERRALSWRWKTSMLLFQLTILILWVVSIAGAFIPFLIWVDVRVFDRNRIQSYAPSCTFSSKKQYVA